jgi:hypothetical protein
VQYELLKRLSGYTREALEMESEEFVRDCWLYLQQERRAQPKPIPVYLQTER